MSFHDPKLLGFLNAELVGDPVSLLSSEAVSSYNWPNLDENAIMYLLFMDLRLNASGSDKYLYCRMNGVAPTSPWWESHVVGHNNGLPTHDLFMETIIWLN